MWTELADVNGGDRACEDPCRGELWQYLCTSKAADGQWFHYFRHRRHPATQQPQSLLIKTDATRIKPLDL